METYFESLKKYPEKKVKEAGYRCLDEMEFFPRPAQIIKFISKDVSAKRNRELRERYTCPVCNNYVTSFIEGKCWECHDNIPVRFGRTPAVAKDYTVEQDFIIAGRMRCNSCGIPGNCIKEPIDTGIWECRQCYTGLTIEQHIDKLNLIINKAFKNMPKEEAP